MDLLDSFIVAEIEINSLENGEGVLEPRKAYGYLTIQGDNETPYCLPRFATLQKHFVFLLNHLFLKV